MLCGLLMHLPFPSQVVHFPTTKLVHRKLRWCHWLLMLLLLCCQQTGGQRPSYNDIVAEFVNPNSADEKLPLEKMVIF